MNQNGLQLSPPRNPTLFQRLFRRPIKENAIIEITNLLAENPIRSLSLTQVAAILKTYDLAFSDVMDSFLDLFRRVLGHAAADRELSAEDREDLAHLQMILNLPDDGVAHMREEVLRELYANSLAGALADSHISPEERARLEAIGTSFGLPEQRLLDIYKEQVMKLLHWNLWRRISAQHCELTSRLKGYTTDAGSWRESRLASFQLSMLPSRCSATRRAMPPSIAPTTRSASRRRATATPAPPRA